MKKIIIIGGGISGMTAGILLQKAGFKTEIYEKNSVIGGLCTGWQRKGYFIDNCIHWLTGTKEGTALHELWKEIGALGDGVETYKKEMFFSSKLNGQTLTFWRDMERTRQEMLALSPADEKEINKLIDYTKLAESMTVPVEKPFDMMNIFEFMKLGMSMKAMGKVMNEYGKMDIYELANRFKHPLIRRAITDYMPSGYQAYAFVVSYATVTSGNGDIPMGGSLKTALRIADKYKKLGGIIHTNTDVEKVMLENKKATGIQLKSGDKISADYVICACDMHHTFDKLLPESYMPKDLKKQFDSRELYPVSSGFQVAFGVDGTFAELTGTRVFSCEKITVGKTTVDAMSIQAYEYEPDFAPKGKMVIQSNFSQSEKDFEYWKALYNDKQSYNKVKQQLGEEIKRRVISEYPALNDKIEVLDIWSPMTYNRYCNCYGGAYMSFVNTKLAKSITTAGVVKGIDNVMLAGQWLMGPGGLPTAAAMGKFAAYRISKKEGLKI